MTPLGADALSGNSFALTLGLLLVAPLAIAGIALVNTGLGRSRSAMQSLLGSLVVISTAVIAFALVGIGPCRGYGRRSCFSFRRQSMELGRCGAAVFGGSWRGLRTRRSLRFCSNCCRLRLWFLFPGDRVRIDCACLLVQRLRRSWEQWLFPLIAHWTWGGGWLAQLGANFSIGSRVS